MRKKLWLSLTFVYREWKKQQSHMAATSSHHNSNWNQIHPTHTRNSGIYTAKGNLTLLRSSLNFCDFSCISRSRFSLACACLAWKQRKVSGKVRRRDGDDSFWCSSRARPGWRASISSSCSKASTRSAHDMPQIQQQDINIFYAETI